MSYYPPNYTVTILVEHNDYDSGEKITDIDSRRTYGEDTCPFLCDVFPKIRKMIKDEEKKLRKDDTLKNILWSGRTHNKSLSKL